MKKIPLKALIVLFLFSCTTHTKEITEKVTPLIKNTKRFLLKDVDSSQFIINDEINNQVNLFKYLYTQYLGGGLDYSSFFVEPFYNSKILYTGEKEINVEKIYFTEDNMQYKSCFSYKYDDKRNIIECKELDKGINSMYFTFKGKKIKKAYHARQVTPWVEYKGNIINQTSPIRNDLEMDFTYTGDVLNYVQIFHKNSFIDDELLTYKYYVCNVDSSMKYIDVVRTKAYKKYSSNDLYHFVNNKIDFIAHSGRSINKPDTLLRDIYLWSNKEDQINILKYRFDVDKKIFTLDREIQIDIDPFYRINKIKITINVIGTTEYYYQYSFQDNKIKGFDIYQSNYNKKDIINKSNNYRLLQSISIK